MTVNKPPARLMQKKHKKNNQKFAVYIFYTTFAFAISNWCVSSAG